MVLALTHKTKNTLWMIGTCLLGMGVMLLIVLWSPKACPRPLSNDDLVYHVLSLYPDFDLVFSTVNTSQPSYMDLCVVISDKNAHKVKYVSVGLVVVDGQDNVVIGSTKDSSETQSTRRNRKARQSRPHISEQKDPNETDTRTP